MHMNMYELNVLCISCNSVNSQFSNTAICAAVNISLLCFVCNNCHSGRLKHVTSEGRGEDCGNGRQPVTANTQTGHLLYAVYSATGALLSYVIRNVSIDS